MSMNDTKIRFVYFDLGNVLVSFNRQRACEKVAALFAGDAAHVDRILNVDGLQNQLETGLISDPEFSAIVREKMRAAADSSVDTETFAAVTDEEVLIAISDMFTPIESMRDVLRDVRKTGIPIGILSNTCNAHWSWIHSQSYRVLEGPFDVCVLSYEERSMKPDRVIYDAAAGHAHRIANATPETILFLDDKEENVHAARQLGWQAEVCFGGDEAKQVLMDYGVLPNHATQNQTSLEAAPRS